MNEVVSYIDELESRFEMTTPACTGGDDGTIGCPSQPGKCTCCGC